MYNDTACPLGFGNEDTLKNILTCTTLRSHHKSSDICLQGIQYEDMFSNNTVKQKQVTELYRQLLHIRYEILSQPVATTGPVHCNNTLQSLSVDLTCGN